MSTQKTIQLVQIGTRLLPSPQCTSINRYPDFVVLLTSNVSVLCCCCVEYYSVALAVGWLVVLCSLSCSCCLNNNIRHNTLTSPLPNGRRVLKGHSFFFFLRLLFLNKEELKNNIILLKEKLQIFVFFLRFFTDCIGQ